MDKETIEKVALLARLQLTDQEVESLRQDMTRVLDYADQLGKLPTDGVEPLAHPGDIVNALRDDSVYDSFKRDALLKNSPKTDGEFYLVPAVLGESGNS